MVKLKHLKMLPDAFEMHLKMHHQPQEVMFYDV